MDDENGTLKGFRDMLRRAAEQSGGQFEVEESSAPKKYADGGEVMEKKEDKKPYSGVPQVQPPMNPVQQALNHIAHKNTSFSTRVPTPEGGTAPGLQITQRFAHGGMVDPNDIPAVPPMAPPAQAVPQLNDVATSLNQTPDTNYDFFKNISAEDRAALQQKLMAQQNSAPSLVAQGAAGLGDAISNSFGGKNTTFQKDVMANNEMQQKKQLEGMETQRSQRLQDMQGNQEMMMNDPKHPFAKGMRDILKSQGVPVPSGMNANIMLKVLGPLGELAYKQAMMGMQNTKNTADIHNQSVERRQGAAKILADRPWYQKAAELIPGVKSDATQEAQAELAAPSAPSSSAPQPQGNSFAPIKHPNGAVITRTK